MSRATRLVPLVLAAAFPLACGPSSLESAPGDTVAVSVALDAAPAGVQCLRLTITMGATVERQLFPLTAGQSTRLQLTGLIAGPATFNADAFNDPCPSVTGRSFPTWTSDFQTVTLSVGTAAKVFLTMHQNVRAQVSVDFVGQPTFQEFPVPSGGSPYLITWGFSGDLWFTEPEYNKVAKITSAGVITEFDVPTAGGYPLGIGTIGGADAWFTEYLGNKIGHVTSAGVFTEYTIPTPNSGPWGLIPGPTGGNWFVENAGNKIGFISSTGAITEYPIPTPNSGPVGIDWTTIGAGSDKLWFTESNAGKVASISFNTGVITEYPVPGGSGLGRISSEYDGFEFLQAMYFVESGADKIASFAFDGTVTEYNLQGAPSPFDVNYAFDGNGYAPEPGANVIARINPLGAILEFEVPTPNSQPFSVPVGGGLDAKIWFTERNGRKIGTMTFP